MLISPQYALMALLLSGLVLTTADGSEASAAEVKNRSLQQQTRSAVNKSLSYLSRDAEAWMAGRTRIQNGTGCISCHQVAFAIWSYNEAERVGLRLDREVWQKLSEAAIAFIQNKKRLGLDTLAQMVLSQSTRQRRAENGKFLHSAVERIVAKQLADGHWKSAGQLFKQNRPRSETDDVSTMWATLALLPFRETDGDIRRRIDKALHWLEHASEGRTNEWLLAKCLLAANTGEIELASRLLASLLRRQNRDGGWSWLPRNPSDALTTGQVLYLLRTGRFSGNEAATNRAVHYLLTSQDDSGRWLTDSQWISGSPTEAKNYVYSYWGSAWATLGLLQVLRDE